ncbi:CARDB domain-containing protein [Deltaproteobacteria bacterium TL4]
MKSLFLAIRGACFLLGGLLMFVPYSQAEPPLPLDIVSIVVSKNCPDTSEPQLILKYIENPECPHEEDTQLIQITVINLSKSTHTVGIETVLTLDGKLVTPSLPLTTKKIFPLDQTRVLHSFLIPKHGGGLFQVSAQLWDKDFKAKIKSSAYGVNRSFRVFKESDLVEIKEKAQKKKRTEAQESPDRNIEFDLPDLRWEQVQVIPKHVLREETFRIRLDLINVGGDIIQNVQTRVDYYNKRLPLRRTTIATPSVDVMAPGETITFEREYKLPEDQLLGEYVIVGVADPQNEIKESHEENNEKLSAVILLSDIKLHIPPDRFVFEEKGLFLFQWDSLAFGEFKLQIGIDSKFEDVGTFFDLPQGDRWIADKELVPLSGELPKMAQGLMSTFGKADVSWRVVGRRSDGKQAFSEVRSFSIKADAE